MLWTRRRGEARAGRWSLSRHAREAILAPVFAADAVMHEEQARRIVTPLDLQQALVIRPPIRALPLRLEQAALSLAT